MFLNLKQLMHFKYLEYMYKFSAYTGTSTTEIWYIKAKNRCSKPLNDT